jgi:hypothetical protein
VRILRRTIAAAVLALSTAASVLTAASWTSAAPAASAAPVAGGRTDPSATRAADERAERVLGRAERIVSGDAPRAPGARVDGTLALRELFTALPDLDPASRREAAAILARPTDGNRDPAGDGYTVSSRRKCDGPVCVHWVPTTRDAPPGKRWVNRNLATMNSVWAREVGDLGYRRPLEDLQRGGNGKFDVYLKELGSKGLYGYCAPEGARPGTPEFLATGYCVLDNDFARSQFGAAPLDSLRVTAAHEFFHAIQFAYDAGEDGWFMEATATWMEERYADGVNDNRQFLSYGQLGKPASVLDVFSSSGWNQYGNWAFFEYLSSNYGVGFVRSIWNEAGAFEGAPDRFSSRAVEVMLRDHGGLPAVFARYAAGNTIPAHTYPEGSAWPKVPMAEKWRLSADRPRRSQAFRIDHLSARNARIAPGPNLTARDWRVRVAVDGPAAASAPAAYLVIERESGRLSLKRLPLGSAGDGRATLDFSNRKVRSVTITLANASTRFHCWVETSYSCQGQPRDDNRKFGLTVRAFRG